MENINRKEFSILIIDDNKDVCELYEEILHTKDYMNTISVYSGKEATQLLTSQFYNIALIDLRLPDMTGIELISKLRNISPETEFIIITGYGSLDSAIKALQFQIGGYLEKPISSEKLIKTIDDVAIKQKLHLENKKFLKDLESANAEIMFLNDLLVNNVDEMNQSLLMTMVQIEDLNPSNEQIKILQLFKETITKNARLTRNIRQLRKLASLSPTSFVKINLSEHITRAKNRVIHDFRNKKINIMGDINTPRFVFANNNIFYLFVELFTLAVLNDPKPIVKINLSFNPNKKSKSIFWQIKAEGFLFHCISHQKNIKQLHQLTNKTNNRCFQELGPFLINAYIRKFDGIISSEDKKEMKNRVIFSLPAFTKE